jgi:hypothetical protein
MATIVHLYMHHAIPQKNHEPDSDINSVLHLIIQSLFTLSSFNFDCFIFYTVFPTFLELYYLRKGPSITGTAAQHLIGYAFWLPDASSKLFKWTA